MMPRILLRIGVGCMFAAVTLVPVYAQKSHGTSDAATSSLPKKELIPVAVSDFGPPWKTLDRNGDGVLDYAVELDDHGRKKREALDYNYDGKMDDFVYFSRGVPVLEELDTNYDGKVDVWVVIRKGVYIERIERDTNYDGKVDVVKVYGKPK